MYRLLTLAAGLALAVSPIMADTASAQTATGAEPGAAAGAAEPESLPDPVAPGGPETSAPGANVSGEAETTEPPSDETVASVPGEPGAVSEALGALSGLAEADRQSAFDALDDSQRLALTEECAIVAAAPAGYSAEAVAVCAMINAL